MDAKLTNRELDQARARVAADVAGAIALALRTGARPIAPAELIARCGDRGLDCPACSTRAFSYWLKYTDCTIIAKSFITDLTTEPPTAEQSPAIITRGGQTIRLLPGDCVTIGIGQLVITA